MTSFLCCAKIIAQILNVLRRVTITVLTPHLVKLFYENEFTSSNSNEVALITQHLSMYCEVFLQVHNLRHENVCSKKLNRLLFHGLFIQFSTLRNKKNQLGTHQKIRSREVGGCASIQTYFQQDEIESAIFKVLGKNA